MNYRLQLHYPSTFGRGKNLLMNECEFTNSGEGSNIKANCLSNPSQTILTSLLLVEFVFSPVGREVHVSNLPSEEGNLIRDISNNSIHNGIPAFVFICSV